MEMARRYSKSWADAALFPELARSPVAPRIAGRLREQILSDALRPSTKLPGQREMAAHMSVSVTTLREAIAILVAEGLLICRHGRGTFVTTGRERRVVEAAIRAATEEELVDMRRFIEAGAAARAAQRASRDRENVLRPVPMTELAWSLRLRHGGEADTWLTLDADFHRELCRLGGRGRPASGELGASILDRLRRRRSAGVHRLVADRGLEAMHMDLAEAVDHGRASAARHLARRIVRREAAAVR
jgi:GntR family transcriptional repressor for pyruvate dehydrogenase complex